jgi:chemotaxis protein methyltransferase CheR
MKSIDISQSGNETLAKIAEFFRQRSGLKIAGRDWHKFHEAIAERMLLLKISNIHTYYQKLLFPLGGGSDEFLQLTALVINPESYFFRDAPYLSALRDIILPRLIESCRPSRQLRIWSAGCSTGEEAYSIAILLSALLPLKEHWQVMIVGTDICEESIAKALRGIYKESSLRDLSEAERHSYFTKNSNNEWLLREKYRTMVKFQQGNLVEDQFPSTVTEFHDMDLIICRNVFIYFHPTAIYTSVTKLANTLKPGGIFIPGHGEVQAADFPSLKGELLPGVFLFKKCDDNKKS